MVKEFLREQNVDFEEADVSVDVLAREEMIQKAGALVVPVTDFGGEIVVGFDREKMLKIIKDLKKS